MNQKVLEELITRYQKAYYDGNELISDAEFDKLWDELVERYPDSPLLKKVGEDSVKNGKVKHLMVMGSQSKFNTEEGLRKWLENESIKFPVQVSDKLDGNSAELQYINGKLLYAVTRGDAVYGEDITGKIKHIVPNTISTKGTVAIRGEVIMSNSVFESKYSADFKNPRNLVAGLVKNEKFTDYSDIMFIAYDVSGADCNTEMDKIAFLMENGFTVPPTHYAKSAEDILRYRATIDPKTSRPYAIDGLVLKQNEIDINDSVEIRPKKQHAFKWLDQAETTVLVDVEWSMKGNSLTPIGILEPVEIEGTTVSRASLSNYKLIKDMGLKIGDTVEVTKRGMIIPKIERVVEHTGTTTIEHPTVCPVCGEPLVMRDNETKLYCSNELCSSQIKARLQKWITVNDVKGLGSAMMDVVMGLDCGSITELYNLNFMEAVKGSYISPVNVHKAWVDLYAKTREVSLAKFIAGFNIGGIGIEMAQTLVDAGYTYDMLSNLKESDLTPIDGWSTIRANAFLTGLAMVKEDMDSLLSTGCVKIVEDMKVEMVKTGISGLHICVTGKLNNFSRKEIDKFLLDNGAISDSGVNKNTDILVTNDKTSGSSKLKNAEKFGTRVISEEELMELVGKTC